MEIFHDNIDDLQCTARNKNSVIAEVYRCVNGSGVLLPQRSKYKRWESEYKLLSDSGHGKCVGNVLLC